MSFSSVAEKSFTGMVTRPKEIAPFHIERGMVLVCLTGLTVPWYAGEARLSRHPSLKVHQALRERTTASHGHPAVHPPPARPRPPQAFVQQQPCRPASPAAAHRARRRTELVPEP